MKSLVYQTPVDSEEDLPVRVMATAKVLVTVHTRTWYVVAVYVWKSLVVTSSPTYKWTQENNNLQ